MPLIRSGRTESAVSYTYDVGSMTKGPSSSIITHMINPTSHKSTLLYADNDALPSPPRESILRVVVSIGAFEIHVSVYLGR
jgi:hypothetical protein